MDGIDLMATAMRAAQARLDVSASNLANVSSDGFQKRVSHVALTDSGLVASSVRDASAPPLRHTGRALDIAVAGNGAFFVRDASGHTFAERSASLERNAHGELIDERGRTLVGTHGAIVASADATIDTEGIVRDGGSIVGRIAARGASLESGFLAGTTVDGMHEMVDVLGAQRAFETAQKTLSALDEERLKDADDVARVKA